MTLRERIAQMLEQYSITKDNPTVLKELLKLSAIVEALTDYSEDLEKKVSDLEQEIDNLDPGQVAELVQSLQEELKDKQDKLTFDDTPTEGSTNPVTSDGIKKAIDAIPGGGSVTLDDTVTQDSQNGVKSSGIYSAIHTAEEALNTGINEAKASAEAAATAANEAKAGLANKQDTLTFDDAPTEGSTNPVTSEGIKRAIDNIPGGETVTLDDTVTQESQNGVKSSGIYNAIQTSQQTSATALANTNKVVTANSGAIEALQEFQQTQEATNQTHNDQIAANIQSINTISGEIAALEADKMDKKEIDANPTKDSQNLVTSGGVFAAVEAANQLAESASEEIARKQDQIFMESGGLVDPYVAQTLTAAPTSNDQLASSLAIWNAIQTAVSGAGGGVKNINVTVKQLEFVDGREGVTGMSALIPDNFIPLSILFTGYINDTDFSGAQSRVNISFEQHVTSNEIPFNTGIKPLFGQTDDNTDTIWLYLIELAAPPKIIVKNNERILAYRDDRLHRAYGVVPQVIGQVNQLESGAYNFYTTYTGFNYKGDYSLYINIDTKLWVTGLEIS